jgi:hypothetical protein
VEPTAALFRDRSETSSITHAEGLRERKFARPEHPFVSLGGSSKFLVMEGMYHGLDKAERSV